MIEFSGYLTGKARQHFIKKSKQLGQRIIAIGCAFMFLPVLSFSIAAKSIVIAGLYLGIVLLFLFLTFIPYSDKKIKSILPNRIFLQEDCIVCIANSYTESKFIDDVKVVYDHGDFYELCFPFGKISEKFICQKDLLICGTLAEFEALFDESIIVR